ncbi:hypothetical protein MKU92_004610 [Salmonella enterica]|nr:hypothetical protein [Salmonella enterica subsp. enterica serovar Oranienburg]EIX6435599.1 hypothetical protein [Salmonella enterica]
MNKAYVIEPISFMYTDEFFSGLSVIPDVNYIVTNSITDAWNYAFEQNLSAGFKIWSDVIEELRSSLMGNVMYQEAYDFINEYGKALQAENSSIFINYRKKKIKKINNKYDDFIFSEAREDAFFVLSTVAINRYLDNFIKAPFLEDVFKIYRAGGWPCGLKEKNILVFDPIVLS